MKKYIQLRFSRRCALCEQSHRENTLCHNCQKLLPKCKTFCTICGVPLFEMSICGQCIKKPPLYSHTIPCFWYEEPMQTLIQKYKFNQKLFLAPVLGKLMYEKIQQYYQENKYLTYPECLIPVPIHPKRLRERGYHQVHELTKILSRDFSIPIDLKTCRRIHHTLPQSQLPFKLRHNNVKNVFKIKKNSYNHIAIIDDVTTTGSTISSLCHSLKKGNSELIIEVWCLAKTRIF